MARRTAKRAVRKPAARRPTVQRYGRVIGIKKAALPKYLRMHAKPGKRVIDLHKKAHIRNYSIYLGELEPGRFYLFAYLEYTGKNFKKDLEVFKSHPTMQAWLKITDAMQNPIPLRRKDEWWMEMKEIFRVD